ncbi:mannose-1-phosphate guanylyltransferase/mannose-6-phosphate isomerase [Balneatrix alpica]|uniref:mannose-1-phosphate guanylyltransferase/mannose-6-phosphate isomerase n=1 Tax=Balneatrix alpica TaxID=75684 RepID=UPI002739E26D|nr:mannose-1-phosphate guanylyltransferase/mannose-6-phosphate isomerase [Balneatrix alpica]
MISVILAGGVGSRLWPLSRNLYPKQFLPLASELSFLQDTAIRLQQTGLCKSTLVITNEDFRFIVAEQFRQLGQDASSLDIVLEPIGRNTCPALVIAALVLKRKGLGKEVMLVAPSDHYIEDQDGFNQSVEAAIQFAKQGYIATFGITPDRPETGFGYIEKCNDSNEIKRFIEKPTLLVAKELITDPNMYWNSGMFAFTADSFLDEVAQYAPEILEICQDAILEDGKEFIRLNAEIFANCQDISIDYAVMERTSKGVVVPLSAKWSDVGSLTALGELLEQDDQENALYGRVEALQTKNSMLYSQGPLIVTHQCKDLMVVATKDAVLVAPKSEAQSVKNVVAHLKEKAASEIFSHTQVYRPWGYYESLASGEGFQVKRIIVHPNQRLSLQRHKYRAEHWIVVRGSATVTCGERIFTLNVNESTYIPQTAIHRLENKGSQDLEIIEIQSGSYLGEDDIERLEDVYGRS